ncbi:MAG: FtsW/RodA/SpoVE family cell cycle protein [Planctomycetota bacterium]|jgi:cell division protein FtsW
MSIRDLFSAPFWQRIDPFRPRDALADAMGVLVPALLLTAIGLLCVYSYGSQFALKQALWAIVGVLFCIGVSRLPREHLVRAASPSYIAIAVVLLLTLLLAPRVENTHRWIVIPGVGMLQPSEFAKILTVLFLAERFSRQRRDSDYLERPWHHGWPVMVICGLIMLAPDLGTAVFLGAVALAMFLLAGARAGRLVAAVVCALPVLLLVIQSNEYMKLRLRWAVQLGYQQDQALIAIGSGGLFGVGLGNGKQKLDFLPAGHTDFVLANLGEEMGFIGIAAVGLLFALILVHGVRVALGADARGDRFGFYLASGATIVVVLQAILNIAVETAAAPPKGISLPFLSQGGSNLMVSLLAIGLIVGVARHKPSKTSGEFKRLEEFA